MIAKRVTSCAWILISVVLTRTALASDTPRDSRVATLADLLAHDGAFKVRASAAQRLGALGSLAAEDERAIARALIEALNDKNDVVRGVAAHAIGQRGIQDGRIWLQQLRDKDENAFVRQAAASALDVLAGVTPSNPRPAKKQQKVELGRVIVAQGSPGLLDAIKDAVDDLLEPHRPAMWPREDPDVRIDVTLVRSEDSSSPEHSIRYEARVILIALPSANLRHASNATASVHTKKGVGGQLKALEKQLALKATTRAVSEALAMLDGS